MTMIGRRLRAGLIVGSALGALYFCADFIGAFLAIGFLADPSVAQVLILLLTLGLTAAAGALAGALLAIPLGVLRRPGWLTRRSVAAMAVVLAAGVSVTGYAVRVQRRWQPEGSRPSVSAKQPIPVLWVLIDTLRADTLYGADLNFPLAPNIGELAKKSVVFTDAEAAAGWTIPSTATLLTGIQPESVYAHRGFIPDWAPTIATRLRAAGYQTHAFIDNALLEPRTGFAQGFETFFQRCAMRFAFTFPGMRILPAYTREHIRSALPVFDYGAPRLTDEALRVLAEADAAPMFMYLHYMDVHFPYYFHPEFGPDPDDTEPVNLHIAMDEVREDHSKAPTPAQMRFLRHRYQNELRFLDQSLGRLLAAWEKRFGSETLIVVTSDHGEEFLEHGELAHGNNLYRESVHVPLLMHVPGVTAKRVDAPVGLVDVLPTALEVVGAPLEQNGIQPDGASWLSALNGSAPPPERPLFASQNRHGRRVYRYREGVWSNITTYAKTSKNELFNLADDPGEHQDAGAAHPKVAKDLRDRFEPFHQAQVRTRDRGPSTSEADAESLKALGYVQ